MICLHLSTYRSRRGAAVAPGARLAAAGDARPRDGRRRAQSRGLARLAAAGILRGDGHHHGQPDGAVPLELAATGPKCGKPWGEAPHNGRSRGDGSAPLRGGGEPVPFPLPVPARTGPLGARACARRRGRARDFANNSY